MERFHLDAARAIPRSSDALQCIDRVHSRTRSPGRCIHVCPIGAIAGHRSLQIDERLR